MLMAGDVDFARTARAGIGGRSLPRRAGTFAGALPLGALLALLLILPFTASAQYPVYQFVSTPTPPANVVTAPDSPHFPACRGKGGNGNWAAGSWNGSTCDISGSGIGSAIAVEFLTVVSGAQTWVTGKGTDPLSTPGNPMGHQICSYGGVVGDSQGHSSNGQAACSYSSTLLPASHASTTTALFGALNVRTLVKISADQAIPDSGVGAYEFPLVVAMTDGTGNPAAGGTVTFTAVSPDTYYSGNVIKHPNTICNVIGTDNAGNATADVGGRVSVALAWSGEPGTCTVTAIAAATATTPDSNSVSFRFDITQVRQGTIQKYSADESLSVSAAQAGAGACGRNCYQFQPIIFKEVTSYGNPVASDPLVTYYQFASGVTGPNDHFTACRMKDDITDSLSTANNTFNVQTDSNGQVTLPGVQLTGGPGTCSVRITSGDGLSQATYQFSITPDSAPTTTTSASYLWVTAAAPPANAVRSPVSPYLAVCRASNAATYSVANNQDALQIYPGYFDASSGTLPTCWAVLKGNSGLSVTPLTSNLQFLVVSSGTPTWVPGAAHSLNVLPPNPISAARNAQGAMYVCADYTSIGWLDGTTCQVARTGGDPAYLLTGTDSTRTLIKIGTDVTLTTAAGATNPGACVSPSLGPSCYQFAPVVAKVVDGSSNPVAGMPVTFSVTPYSTTAGQLSCWLSNGGTPNAVTVTTDSSGLATASALGTFGLKLTGGPGTCTITASSATALNSLSYTMTLKLQDPPVLSKVSSDQTVTSSSCSPAPCYQFPPITAQLTDASGNLVVGGSVTFTATSGAPNVVCRMSGSGNSFTAITNGSGQVSANGAAGYGLQLSGALGTCTVTAVSTATILNPASNSITFSESLFLPPPTSNYTVEAVSGANQTLPQGSKFAITIRLRDSNGLPAAGKYLNFSCQTLTKPNPNESTTQYVAYPDCDSARHQGTTDTNGLLTIYATGYKNGTFSVTAGGPWPLSLDSAGNLHGAAGNEVNVKNTVTFIETVGAPGTNVGVNFVFVPNAVSVNPVSWDKQNLALWAPVTVQLVNPDGSPAGAGNPVTFHCSGACGFGAYLQYNDWYQISIGDVTVTTGQDGRATLPAFRWTDNKPYGLISRNEPQNGIVRYPVTYSLTVSNPYSNSNAVLKLTDPGGPLSGASSSSTGCYRTIINKSWFTWHSDALGVDILPGKSATIDWYKLYNTVTDTQYSVQNGIDWALQGIGGAPIDLSVVGGPGYKVSYNAFTSDPTGKTKKSALAYGIGISILNAVLEKALEEIPFFDFIVMKLLYLIEDQIGKAFIPDLECAAIWHDADDPHLDLNSPSFGDITIKADGAGFNAPATADKPVIVSGNAQTKTRIAGGQTSAGVPAAFFKPLQVALLDVRQNPMPNQPVTWTCVANLPMQCAIGASGGTSAVTTTDSNGIATLNLVTSTVTPWVNGSSAAVWGGNGPLTITASYPLVSTDFTLTANQAAPQAGDTPIPTRVSVISSGTPSGTGKPVTFTASLTLGDTALTAGAVTFLDGVTVIADSVPVSNGVATTVATLSEGTHTITAAFHDSGNTYADSSGRVVQVAESATVQSGKSYCNTGGISVSGATTAGAYPSRITLPGLPSALGGLTLSLNGFTSDFPNNLSLMLAGPAGQNMVIWSGVGGGTRVSNLNITLDDAGTQSLSANTLVTTGTYRPTAANLVTFPAPASSIPQFAAPQGSGTFSSVFAGTDTSVPGVWSLYVLGGAGATSLGGWCVSPIAAPAAPTTTKIISAAPSSPASLGTPVTFTARVQLSGSAPVTSGNVTFKQRGITVSSPIALDSTGSAQFTLTPPEGTSEITAVYSGTPTSAPSSGTLSYTVDAITQTTTRNGGALYCNASPVQFPGSPGAANPYASRVLVAGAATTLSGVSLTLKGLNLGTGDIPQFLLVSPHGDAFDLFSRPGSVIANNATITLSDAAADKGQLVLPGTIATGIYLPISGVAGSGAAGNTYLSPVLTGPYAYAAPAGLGKFMSTLGSADPNGYWSLYATQSGSNDGSGGMSLKTGWCLNLSWLADPVITLSSSVNPSQVGQSVTVTATLTGVNGNTPTGKVAFRDGLVTLAQATLSNGTAPLTATATINTPGLAVGSHPFSLTYTGDANFNSAVSSTYTQSVPVLKPSVTLTGTPNPAVAGQVITFTATVSGDGPQPSGSVTFFSGPSTMGTVSLVNGVASQTAFFQQSLSDQKVTARYQGDGTYSPATSTAWTQNVQSASSTVSVVTSASPALSGTLLTFSAHVGPVAPSVWRPTGSVTFFDGATRLGSASMDIFGNVSWNTAALTPGNHTITVTFAGNDQILGSSGTLQQGVTLLGSTTALTAAANPAAAGQSFTLQATVTSGSTLPTDPAPTGSVSFFGDGTLLGTAPLVGGIATLTTTGFGANSHSFTARYFGTPAMTGSTSAPVSVSVTGTPQSISFVPLRNQSVSAAPFTVAATATSGLTVTLTSTTPSVCTVSGSTATIVAAGTCAIQATQSGDFVYNSATPVSRTFQVLPGGTQTITFAGIPDQTYGSGALTLYASSTSGLPVIFTSASPQSCLVSGTTVTLLAPGLTCTVQAAQPGNSAFVPATPVTRSFTIVRGPGSGTFKPGAPLATGSLSDSPLPAVGDFNGDGKLDLALIDLFGNGTLLLGDGTGGFGAGKSFATGGGVYSVAAGDFDGDGKLDLAVVTADDNSVSVLMGDGAGGFGAVAKFPTGASPRSVIAVDFNGDGYLDLAVANSADDTVSILLGDGSGRFGTATVFPTGTPDQLAKGLKSTPVFLIAGDFDSDGQLDLAVASSGTDTVNLLTGNGLGSFAAPKIFGSSVKPAVLAAARLSGYAFPDIAAASSQNKQIDVMFGQNFRFSGTPNFQIDQAAVSLVAADFNQDGNNSSLSVDFVAADGDNVAFVVGNDFGQFGTTATFSPGLAPRGLAVGDFNGDGRPDVAVTFGLTAAGQTDHHASILLGSAADTTATLTSTVAPNISLGTDVPMSIAIKQSGFNAGTGFNPPTGTITLYDGSTVIGTVAPGAIDIVTRRPTPATFKATGLATGDRAIRAVYSGDSSYGPSTSNTVTFYVSHSLQTIYYFPAPGDRSFFPGLVIGVNAAASSHLPIMFTSNTPSVCSLSGTTFAGWEATATLTALGGGTCSVTASQGGDSIWSPAPPVTQTFQITPGQQSIGAFSIAGSDGVYKGVPLALSAVASSGLPVSFASTTPQVCSVAGASVTLLSVGTCTIQATQPGNATYAAAPPYSLSFKVVTRYADSLNFGIINSCLVPPANLTSWWRGQGDALDATGSFAGTLGGNTTFATGKVGQAFSFDGSQSPSVSIPAGAFPFPKQTPFTFETWFSTKKGGVILGQQSGAAAYGSVTAKVPAVYVGMDGLLRTELFWSGSVNPISSPFPVNDGKFHHVAVTYDGTNETTYLDGFIIGTRAFTQTDLGGPYYYQLGTGGAPASDWPSGANTFWYTFNGLIDEPTVYQRALTFDELQQIVGWDRYGKCPPAALSQTVTFGALGDQALGSTVPPLSATASTGLPITFLSTTPLVCTVSGVNVTLLTTGTCTIRAMQAGTSAYSAAAVDRSFQVKTAQTITFAPLSDITYGTAPVTISATASSQLPVSFASTTASVCTVSGATVTLVSLGACTVQATQAGNAAFAPALPVSQTFQVVFTAPANACLVPPANLTSWWRGQGDTLDAAGAFNGTLGGNTSFAAGKVGQAFAFDGSQSSVALPSAAVPLQNQKPFTFETWFRTSTGGVILGKQTPAAYASIPTDAAPLIYVGTDGLLRTKLFWTYSVNLGGLSLTTSAVAVNDGSFHHVAVSYDGTTQTTYLDGILIGTLPVPVVDYGGPYNYQLGTANNNGGTWPGAGGGGQWYTFNGQIDEASIYQRALTLGEIDQIVAAGSFGKCPPGFASQTITFGEIGDQGAGTVVPLSATASSGLAVAFSSSTPLVCTVSGANMSLLITGTCTIQATQPGNSAWLAATPITRSFLVKPSQAITFGALSGVAFGTAPFAVSATATSGLTVAFSSTTPTVCTVAGTTVTLVAAGTCSISATQPGNVGFAPAPPVVQSFTVTQGPQTITFAPLNDQVYGSPTPLLSATASSSLPVTFVSTTTPVCTVSGVNVTLLKSGVCTIQATQAGNTSYLAAPAVNRSFNVAGSSQTITFAPLADVEFGVSPFAISATASSGLPVTLTSNTTAVCAFETDSAILHILNLGTCSITASQAGSTLIAPAISVTNVFTATKASQTIAFGPIGDQLFGAQVLVPYTASSGLVIVYSSNTPQVCAVTNIVLQLLAPGRCEMVASQPGNARYAPAVPVTQSFTITIASQTITFDALGDVASGAQFVIAARASSGLPITFTSNTTAVCVVGGNVVTTFAPGTCSITASQPGSAGYQPATPVTQQFTVRLGTQAQIITFGPISDQALGAPAPVLSATASSGLAVAFSSTTPLVCTVSGANVTTLATGLCTIQANQPGDGTYAPATSVNRSFQVLSLISFGALNDVLNGIAPFTISASASSGLTVAFASNTTAVCAVSGSTVTILSAGKCSITASQPGDATFAAALPVTRSFKVTNPVRPAGTLSVVAGSPFATGTGPTSMAAGDFNGDGRSDLVIANLNSNNVSVWLGTASGGFTAVPGSPIAVGSGPSAIRVGDFNGDGYPDLVVANQNDNNVTILLGDGNGGFNKGRSFAVGALPVSIAVGDFNADGKSDLAVANFNGNSLTILLGDGSGGFSSFVTLPSARPKPRSVVAYSIFGHPGLAVAVGSFFDPALGNVDFWRGDGTGAFASIDGTGGPGLPVSLAVDDFNRDGQPDVAVANSFDNNVTAMFYDGGAFSWSPASQFSTGPGTSVVAAGDFNGDGNPDLIVGNQSGASVTLLLGDGSGGFKEAVGSPFTAGTTPNSLAVGDFNGDGRLDVAVSNHDTNSVTLLLGALAPTTPALSTSATSPVTAAAAIPLTVTLNQSGFSAPTGAVTFYDGGSSIGTAAQTSSPYTFSTSSLAAGTHSLTAVYAGDSRNAGGASNAITIQVNSPGQSQTITFGTLNSVSYGAAPFTVSATASSGLTVSFASATTTVCTVSGTTVTIIGGGVCSITATQTGNATWAAAPAVTRTFTVAQASQTITFPQPPDTMSGLGPVILTATASSNLPVTYTSTYPVLCAVSGSSVNQVRGTTGPCTITANQPGDANFSAAPPVSVTFNFTAANIITFPQPADTALTAGPVTLTATASSTLAVSYTSNSAAVCTVSGSNATLVSVGTCSITATQPGNSGFPAAVPVTQTFGVLKGSQTISFTQPADISLAAGTVNLAATAAPGLTVSFQSNTLTICTVSGSTVTLLAAGQCSIAATQSGSANYNAAAPVTKTFNINGNVIAFPQPADTALTAGPVTLSATASSGLAVGYTSNTTLVCTVSGNSVTLLISGTCSVTATQPGNGSFPPATPVTRTFSVLAGAQSITFTQPADTALNAGPVTLTAVATSGLTVSFASNTPGVCTVTGSSVKLLAIGQCSHTATQPGSANYSAATPVTKTFAVTQGSQIIAFGQPVNTNLGAVLPALTATASSGLDVSFVSLTTSVCTVSGANITLVTTGTCTIQAAQAGNASWAVASPVSRSFTVGNGPYITFQRPPNQVLGTAAPALVATSSTGLPVSFSSRTPSVCLTLGTTLALLDSGICTIQATQPGDATHGAAAPVTVRVPVTSNPSGSLTASSGSPFATGGGVTAVTVADFNGDGKPDVATANQSGSVTVLIGDGSGGFTPASGSPIAVASYPDALIAGDFNGDGKMDLAVGTQGNSAGNLLILYGNGSGGFTAGTRYNLAEPITTLVAGDFNNDGVLDLATTFQSATHINVLLGNGAGGFTAAAGSPLTVGTGPVVMTADFDGDGNLDLAASTGQGNTVYVLLGNGAGGFTGASGSPFTVGNNPFSIAVGDFNGDGVPDIATANQSGDTVSVLLGNGAGGFNAAPSSPFAVGSAPRQVVVGDFNGDSKADIITASQSGNNLTVLLGDGTGGFTASAGNAFATGTSPHAAAVADFNGDGRLDIVTANQSGNNLSVLLGGVAATTATLTTTAGTSVAAGTAVPLTLAVTTANNAFAAPAGTATFYDGATALGTAAQSGGPFTFSTSALSGSSHSLTAAYVGDGRTASATSNAVSVTITGGSQTITFDPLSNQTLGTAPFTLTATASSGLPVSFSSTTTAVCTISAATVTLLSAGTCSITSSQAGNANFLAAVSVSRSFTVSTASGTVTLSLADGTGVPGQAVEIAIQIATSGVSTPAGFQADLNFDSTKLAFASARAGAQTTNAGKSLTTNTLPNGDVRLLVTGLNQNSIANGIVAYAKFTVNPLFTAGSTVVTPKNCSSTNASGGALATPCTAGTIRTATCDINLDRNTNVSDVQLIINEALGVVPAVHDLNGDGSVNVSDVQKVINAALGLGCTLP